MEDNEQAAVPAAAEGTTAPPNPAPEAPTPEQADNPAPEGQEGAAPEPEEDDEDAPVDISKPLTKSQLRRLQRQNREREREAENAHLRQIVQRIAPPSRVLSVEERIGAPPNPQNYQNNAAGFYAAKAAYDVHKQVAEKQIAAEKTVAEERENARKQAIAQDYYDRQAKSRARLPDYDKVMASAAGVKVSQPVIDAIVDSELAPEIEYHLALNPAKLNALNQMSPKEAARAVGRLEEVLRAAPPPRNVTQAPPPPSRLNGGSAGPVKSLAELAKGEDASAYIAARRAAREKQQKRA